MGLLGAILGCLGGLSAILGVLNILQVPSDPIISDKLTWTFWLMLSGILFLAAITSLIGRSPGQGGED